MRYSLDVLLASARQDACCRPAARIHTCILFELRSGLRGLPLPHGLALQSQQRHRGPSPRGCEGFSCRSSPSVVILLAAPTPQLVVAFWQRSLHYQFDWGSMSSSLAMMSAIGTALYPRTHSPPLTSPHTCHRCCCQYWSRLLLGLFLPKVTNRGSAW